MRCFSSPGSPPEPIYSVRDDPEGPGFPIRKSTDQRLLAAPRGLSQRATSFIASWRQGIHQMPLRRLLEHPVTHSDKNRHHISGTFNALMLDQSATEPQNRANKARPHGNRGSGQCCPSFTMSKSNPRLQGSGIRDQRTRATPF